MLVELGLVEQRCEAVLNNGARANATTTNHPLIQGYNSSFRSRSLSPRSWVE